MTRRSAFAAALLAAAATAARAEETFCAALVRAVETSEAEGIGAVAGLDNGMFRTAGIVLPGSKLCVAAPDETPDASWRCLLDSDSKYTRVLQLAEETADRIEGCLGSAWTREETRGGAHLRVVRFSRPGSGLRVEVRATNSMPDFASWKPHRVVVAVLAPYRAPQ